MFQRILVPLDGSPRAEQALPVAARLAHASGGSLHILQVLSFVVDYDGGMAPVSLVTEQSVAMETDQATSYLRTVTTFSALKGIPTTTEVAVGLPAQSILATAEAREIDLIVLCSHGRTGFLRWALGSVAHTLAHESTVPLLVLRAGEPAPLRASSETARPFCTLVPLDGSPLAEVALGPAMSLTSALAAPGQGTLHLAQVVKLLPATAEESVVNEIKEKALQRARAYLARVTERLQTTLMAHTLTLTSSVTFETDVSSTLLHLAEHEGEDGGRCDLLALSTHGRGGLERWVMGSVTEHLLTNTTVPMLIVRPLKQG